MNDASSDLREQLRHYLAETFGGELVEMVAEPEGVRVGERVLYKLAGDRPARRREPTVQELDEIRRSMVRVGTRTGARQVSIEPPVSSGLPCPRLIDIPGSEILWDRDLTRYVEHDEPLPSSDFPLEWAIGVLLMPSQKLLLYLDFIDPKVKGIFRVFYDTLDEADVGERILVRERFREFRKRAESLKTELAGRHEVRWAKVVQKDHDPLSVRIDSAS